MSPEDTELARQARDMRDVADNARAVRRDEYAAALESNDTERVTEMQAELVARYQAVGGDRDWTRTLDTSGSVRNAIIVYAEADRRISAREVNQAMTPGQRDALRKHELENNPAYRTQVGERRLSFSEDRQPGARDYGELRREHSNLPNGADPNRPKGEAKRELSFFEERQPSAPDYGKLKREDAERTLNFYEDRNHDDPSRPR